MSSEKETGFKRFPQDWEDDVKMTVMFSPFREKSLNPKGWDQKMKFWTELIQLNCVDCHLSMITITDLRERFRRKGKMPSCLPTVVQEMISNGIVKKLQDVQNKSSEGWLSWGFNKLVREPVGWSMKILPWQQEQKKQNDTEEIYVVLEVLQNKAKQLLERHTGRLTDDQSNVIEYKELEKLHTDLWRDETEFTLVLQQLQNTNRVVIQQVDKDKKLVKFIHEEQKTSKKEIEEKDIHIHKIQLAKESLKKQIKSMAEEVDSLGKEAVSLKAQGHKSLAMSSMRKRKLAQNRIAKLTGSLDTLEEILFRIKQAESNEMVLRAIEGGTSILKGITSKTTAEEVEEIMENLADVSHSQDELSTELGVRVGGDEPSMTELEYVLNDIMADDNARSNKDNSHAVSHSQDELSKELGVRVRGNEPSMTELEDELNDVMADDNVSHSQDELSAELGVRVGGDEPSMTELEDELNDIMADDKVRSNNDKFHSTFIDDKDSEFDAELEKELADILKDDREKDKSANTSLSDMLDDLQLPDVPTHSPQKDQRAKKMQALFS